MQFFHVLFGHQPVEIVNSSISLIELILIQVQLPKKPEANFIRKFKKKHSKENMLIVRYHQV